MAALGVDCSEASEVEGNNFSCQKTADSWKRDIIRQLKHRDKSQKSMFQDVIRSYISLLERTNQQALITKGILGSGSRHLASSSDSLPSLISKNDDLKKITGELAYQVVELQQEIRIKDSVLEGQAVRMCEVQRSLQGVQSDYGGLAARVAEVTEGNRQLKREYDALLERHHDMDQTFRVEKVRGQELLEDLIKRKQHAAVRMNSRNERRVRAREASLQKELETAGKLNVTINVKKRRGNSVCLSLQEDLYAPVGICVAARVPARALHVLDAHELGINAVRFSYSSNLLATGGTDRSIKLWDVKGGMLHNRGTLDGSNEGITSIEFDPTGTRVLAGSYDKSALFWRLDDSVPKLTLTGHSRKVTAAKFKCSMRHVVTGSADRTVKIWDLHRAACIQTIEVLSYCSDVVCSEFFIVSGHYDRKIRFWDSRAASCTQEVPLPGKVTSLDISPDHRQLLSCSRDETLHVVDLRMNSCRICFRAEGFKCGCDNTKAIFSPDGSYLAAGSADGAVYIWNINTGNLETRLPEMHSSSINAVAWSGSGEYVVSVDKSRRAVLWSDI
ncbi:autophagy-related protein 16-2 isoform X3 [Esox lucius]|uniref:autophagy-related protein 16-2 isoform X3 n=1 Tax=Esox lucius TaxID=8010 RepID=UPI0009734B4A|nr:autophagy-related protein 16-2 isoform X3 [Esox lucius]